MKFRLRRTAFAALALSTPMAYAVDTTMTAAGFTGLGITPNAHLLDWGRFEFSYDRQLPGVVRDPQGHNFVTGFGLFPNVEISGRLASNTLNSNCFTEGCGARDLSASAKAAIGLDTANRFHAGVGVTDVGGSVTYFRTYYGVLTYNEGPWEVSGGLAHRSGSGVNGSRSPLDGPFAAAAWQPLPLVRGQLEYADRNVWAGARVFAPKEWLPEGWNAYVGANVRLTDSNLTQRAWFNAGISIPLYKVPSMSPSTTRAPLPQLSGGQMPLPAYEARSLPATPPATAEAPPATLAGAVPDDQVLLRLATLLEARGLEDISIGRMPDGSIAVRANNATYNWNTVDAIGAALSAVSEAFAGSKAVYRLVLTQRQIPLVAVTGQADCLQRWIAAAGDTCPAGELSTPGTTNLDEMHAGANWVVRGEQPSWKTLRVGLSPVLRTTVGTEFGVFDYSAGASVAFVQPLWSGASAEWRVNQELARSDDFKTGGIFHARRVKSGTDRIAFTQTWRVPLERWIAQRDPAAVRRWGLAAVTSQVTIGRVGGSFDGVLASARWEPGEGLHRVGVEAGTFRNHDFGSADSRGPRTATPILANYRYNVTATRTYLEATAGRFMFNDLGVQLGLRQWFSDFSVGVFYRRSKFENTSTRQFVGLEITVPIGPRKDMNPTHHLQVTGDPRFSQSIESTVRAGRGNPLVGGTGITPPAPSLEETFNSDRAGLLYFEDNIRRIRDAARQTK